MAHGGSLVMYAGLCRQMGQGRVLGIDIEIHENRRNIENHEFASFIELYEGSSIERDTFDHAKEFAAVRPRPSLFWIQSFIVARSARDRIIFRFSKRIGYLVVMDGGQAFVSDILEKA